MSYYRINKSTLSGEIQIPSSKSHTLRAILFGALGKGKSIIQNYLPSQDTEGMIEACRNFGAKLEVFQDLIEIEGVDGKINHFENVIDVHNSGITLRFCTSIGALAKHPVVITGDYSIRHHRTMIPLLDGLSQLGVKTMTLRGDGYAPVIVQGPIHSGKTIVSGEDSQTVSGLLIAAAFAPGPIEILVQNPGEKSWVALTLNWLDRLGIACENQNFERFQLKGNSRYPGFVYEVPGDLSSSAFPIAAALITDSEVTVKNVDLSDVQGDKELIRVFQEMGADIEVDNKNKAIHVKKGGDLKGVTVDINNYVDAITILAVVACFAEGETVILNARIAKEKECDRIACITSELKKMNADIEAREDGLVIRKSSLKGAKVHSYHDHRMAMSLAVAGFGAEGTTHVESIECVGKTFPKFMEDFKGLGAHIHGE